MNNRQILNERWSKIDDYLLSYFSNYNKINRKMIIQNPCGFVYSGYNVAPTRA